MKKMKSKGQIAAFFLAIIMFIGIWGIPTFAAADSKAEAFKDVPESAWYHGYVMMLADKGIVRCFGSTGEFRPLNKLTRGQAAKMLAIAAGLPYEGKQADFPDVDKKDEMSPYIAALYDIAAIRGFPDGSFRPGENITRGQAAKIVALAFGIKEGDLINDLTDLPEELAVKTAIEMLTSNGIVKGYESKLFKPFEKISRAEFSKIVCLAMVVAAIQKAEENPTTENLTAAQALLNGLPKDQDQATRTYLQGRLDEAEGEQEA